MTNSPALALSIAGSEATGGAGAQADLKTFQALDVFGTIALTCIVSFDPKEQWSHRFVPIEPAVIADQLEAILTSYDLDTVKLGMMGTVDTIGAVATALRSQKWRDIVLDPVLICKGQEPGAALDTDEALKSTLVPMATVVTPNHFEAVSLSGMEKITSVDDLKEAAKRIHDLGPGAVLVKGGIRLPGAEAVDVFYDGKDLDVLTAPKVGEVAVAGAGCTLAAAITAELAKGGAARQAAATAKDFVTAGIHARVSSHAPFDTVWQGSGVV